MKSIVLKSFTIATIVSLLLVGLSTSSCKKDETCHGKVIVKDTLGKIVVGARVSLDALNANPPGQVKYAANTDSYGAANFDIKLPGIFDIVATKSTFPNMIGKGVMNVDEPGKETEVTVIIVN